jgi:hypothetical protein
MTDLGNTIAPKSDQLNSDDLIAGPRTITITRVTGDQSAPEQPVSIFFDGDGGKPWKPCKSMRRVMVAAWGREGDKYAGRSLTLYRDPAVKFGGIEVGGIRISHMSHIERDLTMPLTITRAKRAAYVVKRLDTPAPTKAPAPDDGLQKLIDAGELIARQGEMLSLGAWWTKELTNADRKALGPDTIARLKAICEDVANGVADDAQGDA